MALSSRQLRPALPATNLGPLVIEKPAAAPAIDWEAVRIDYLAESISLRAIQRKHGLTEAALRWGIRTRDWPHRSLRPVGRTRIITRMFRMLERQITQLEKNMTSTGDKEVTVLGKLAGTLEKLIDIESKAGAGKPVRKQTREMLDIRNRLIKRIEQLKQQ